MELDTHSSDAEVYYALRKLLRSNKAESHLVCDDLVLTDDNACGLLKAASVVRVVDGPPPLVGRATPPPRGAREAPLPPRRNPDGCPRNIKRRACDLRLLDLRSCGDRRLHRHRRAGRWVLRMWTASRRATCRLDQIVQIRGGGLRVDVGQRGVAVRGGSGGDGWSRSAERGANEGGVSAVRRRRREVWAIRANRSDNCSTKFSCPCSWTRRCGKRSHTFEIRAHHARTQGASGAIRSDREESR